MAIELYKSKNGLAPVIMNEIFTERRYNGPDLRSQADFYITRVNTVHKGDDLLRYLGPLILNIVPDQAWSGMSCDRTHTPPHACKTFGV